METTLFNTAEYFHTTRIDPLGFREYDARWIIEPLEKGGDVQINYRGLTQIGKALGEFLKKDELGRHQRIVVGHDFRSYAENAKNAVVVGLLAAGMDVVDVGLCLTPMVYFAQFELSIAACAMITASHNPNGWTGLKMGHGFAKTFGPTEMSAFRKHCQAVTFERTAQGGSYTTAPEMRKRYMKHLVAEWSPRLGDLPRLQVAVETGNGTAGLFLPQILSELGFQVTHGHTKLDWDFPHFNPNPESIPFLRGVQQLVGEAHADVGLCVDGDGDRLGVVDDAAEICFSDRIGLLLAKRLIEESEQPSFVVDVKSTSLYDSFLPAARIVWEKTGHSYIKEAVAREEATAGFERSGHFFFAPPFGNRYDDACVSSLVLLWLLSEAKSRGKKLSSLLAALPKTHQSPNRQPTVPDERKYQIMDKISRRVQDLIGEGRQFAGQAVRDIVLINGVRVVLEDGSWLLIRASSNTPNLVILAESCDEDGALLARVDREVRGVLGEFPEVGDFEPLFASL